MVELQSADNPNDTGDRYRNETWKPVDMDEKRGVPFHSGLMDYCDPYHCNQYSKPTCGLNRENMRFQWFQSQCHLLLHNLCAYYRGHLKFDIIEAKFCTTYVKNLREGCSTDCPEEVDAVCAISVLDNHVAMFKNRCVLERQNCKGPMQEYVEVYPEICLQILGE